MHAHALSHAERGGEIFDSLWVGKKLQESDSVGGTWLVHLSNTMQFTNESGLWKAKIKTDSSLHI